jgi:hypothetical protein
MKKALVFLSALTLALAFLPVCVQAQYFCWHYDRLIENNAGLTGCEPDIAISGTKAVAVWYQSGGSNRRIYANYSIDGGKTWHADQIIENINTEAYSPHVAMSGNIAVAAWNQWYSGYYRIFTNYSTDGGKTWHTSQIIEDLVGAGALSEGPAIAVSGTRVFAAWSQSDGSHYRIYVNYSTDGGKIWHSRQPIDNVTAYGSGLPTVAFSGLNAVVAWPRYDGSVSRAYANYSADGGATWHTEQLLEDNTGYNVFNPPRVAISGTNAVAVWDQSSSSLGRSVYSNYSTDGGATWHSDQMIKSPVTSTASYPQVAMSGTKVVAVWIQYDTSGFNYICSNHSTDSGATWDLPHAVEANTTYAPSVPHVALSGLNAIAVWRQPDGSGDRVFTSYSTNAGESWPKLRTLDGIAGTTAGNCFPKIALSGTKAAAVWVENDGVSDRIVSNYAGYFAKEKYYLRPPKLKGPANGSVSVAQPVTLSWQDTNDPSGPQELKYKIRIKPAGGTYAFINVPANSVIYVKSGLARNKAYSWNVQAVGNGTTVLNSSWANGGVDWKFTTAF